MKASTIEADTENKLRSSSDRPRAIEEKLRGEPWRASNRAAVSFRVLIRQDNGQGFRIRDKVIIIGRSYECDLRVEKPQVSGVHAVICRENGCLVLEDLGGKNGTRVNRIAVSRKVLSEGDRIHIGRAKLGFRSGC